MKYLVYLIIVIGVIVSKIIGIPMFFLTVWFRKYSRNVVHNYHFQKGLYLQRRLQGNPKLSEDGKTIELTSGSFKYRKISRLEYWFAFYVLWIWMDDNSKYDTWSHWYSKAIIDKKKLPWLPKWIYRKIQKDLDNAEFFGDVWNCGDSRSNNFRFWSSLFWVIRNTAYNIGYKSVVRDDFKHLWYIEFPSIQFKKSCLCFGWKPVGKDSEGREIYILRFVMNW